MKKAGSESKLWRRIGSDVATVDFAYDQIIASLEVIKKRYEPVSKLDSCWDTSSDKKLLQEHITVIKNGLARIENAVGKL